jgi:4-aminobutyrate aminotransferase-like enzyme/Ser/Thr protein kinase RdoA (MazF antagonist)
MNHSTYQYLSITNEEASNITRQFYNLNIQTIKTLQGEVDFNYYIQTKDGKEFTLKISRPNPNVKELEFQTAILQHLAQKNLDLDLPIPVSNQNGDFLAHFGDNENIRYIRLQSWVSGRVVNEVQPRSVAVLESWGKTCGKLSKALQDFDHEEAHRFYKWNPSETLQSRPLAQYFKTKDEKEIANYFWNLFEQETLPKLSKLRKSVNYNDAHELNLIASLDIKNPQINGVIDFGDALFCETINELAIACAYACMNCPAPLEAASYVVKGYHSVFPLQEQELDVLFSLINARLLITVASSAYNKHIEPDNEYLFISEQPAWDLLKKLRQISPSLAHYTFRNACGIPAHPKSKRFHQWLEFEDDIAPIVNFGNSNITPLDLSVGSLDLGNNSNFSTLTAFQKNIDRLLEDKNADIGIGGYGETRPFYTTDAYQVKGNNGLQWRTVHLGFDIWNNAGTPVYAPVDGKIHSFHFNNNVRDYGATIILEHTPTPQLTFYTLYGHLSLASLKNLEKGQLITKGQKIAEFGIPEENGHWAPHLHFQVMLDMLGNEGDFPGVAFPNEADVWLSICPNPILLIPDLTERGDLLDFENLRGLEAAEILNQRKKHLGRSLSISYKEALHIVRGFGQYLYDTTGRRYLDTVNNVAHVGHEHPKVVKAAQRQIGVLNTNTRYLHENIVRYAEKLCATLPSELSVVHFVNSGSEANELALRMAEAYSGQKDMIAVEVGYHGNTNRVIDVSSYKFDGKGGKGAPATTHIVPIPDVYRGKFKNPETAGKQYAQYIQEAISEIQSTGRNVAGFICESILSCGGQIELPKDYLKTAFEYVRVAGGVCIADEVQVGFGRVGQHFWGFELSDVVPDIVTMGKPIGNGHPLAAVVCTPAVANAFANGMEYFNTFGGNPVSCAIGEAVLEVIETEQLQHNALEVGEYLKAGLRHLQSKYPIIGDVRGQGFFLGFELVRDEQLTPADTETSYLANRMRELGFLMSTDGLYHNVIKIKPPMCFSKPNADLLLEYLEMVLTEDGMQRC